jgi:membrane fusion protein (multidrug efflux system)
MALGRAVRAGDALVELDVRAEELQRDEVRARLDALAPQRAARLSQIASAERALDVGLRQDAAAAGAARARLREAATLAAGARADAERADRLLRGGQGSAAEAEHARSRAAGLDDALAAARLDVRRLELEGRSTEATRRAAVDSLRGDEARLAGDDAALRATLAGLAHQAERRVLRAASDGTLDAVTELRPGSVVAEGQRLAVVVPGGELRVVAEFAPGAALGRVRAGQAARVRLDGFPWAQWGAVAAVVRRVAAETRAGTVRVELALPPCAGGRIPLSHGLPGSVEVEVERVSPAELVLRAAGQRIAPAGEAR